MIKPTKSNDKPVFEDVLNEVEQEIEGKQAEENIIAHAPMLKQLSDDIEKATTTYINATLELESAIQMYKRAEQELDRIVKVIGDKVDTINNHIDNVIRDAPTKLQVTVTVSETDKQMIQTQYDQHNLQMRIQMQKHLQEINEMFAEERRKVQQRYKEYDGCYFGYRAQWFFLFFFLIGIFVVATIIGMAISKYYGWY